MLSILMQRLKGTCNGMSKKNNNLDKFGRPLPQKVNGYYVPSVTTDAVVIKKVGEKYEILMITRKNNPFKGCYALPGGFLDYNENPQDGCLRELLEETSIKGKQIELLTVEGEPLRDPRGHVVSIVYLVTVDADAQPIANDDAATAQFYDLQFILQNHSQLAFDHHKIITLAASKFN